MIENNWKQRLCVILSSCNNDKGVSSEDRESIELFIETLLAEVRDGVSSNKRDYLKYLGFKSKPQ